MEYKFGYCDIEHKNVEKVEELLLHHGVAKYIIGLEKVDNGTHKHTNGEHMHFVLYVDHKQMKNIRESLRYNYNLGSKNQDKPFYGWEKKPTKNLDRFIAYSVKDQNIRWLGFQEDEIQKYIEESFPKDENLFNKCLKHLKSNWDKCLLDDATTIDFDFIELEVLKYHINNDSVITKPAIKNITRTFLQKELKHLWINYDDNINQIFQYTMQR